MVEPMFAAEPHAAQRRSPTGHYEVVAVRYATLTAPKSHLFYRYETYGEPDAAVEMAYYFWVLRAGGETILVDTGFDPVVGARRGRTCLCRPVDALRRLGIEPESVSAIVVTHLHYDHIGNLDAFPQAALVVPRRELEFWTGPIAARSQFGSHVEAREVALLEEAQRAGRVRLTEGVEEIFDGITAHSVGGHSPGQQVTVVSTPAGDVVLASDAVHFYEELELDRPFAVIADLERMYAAYDMLRELAASSGAVVIPGHDPEVLTRFPALDRQTDGIAVRLA
jgi:glyoxylase-like metal-dependent hydrolase (beta-lactamase superfamily II)